MRSLAVVALPLAAGSVEAHCLPRLLDADAPALALGYHSNAASVDRNQFPQYRPGESCSRCAMFAGAHGDGTGRCAIFTDNLVALGGWCSAFTAKG